MKSKKEKEEPVISDALSEAMKKINERHGENSVLLPDQLDSTVETLSTGCFGLDDLLGSGVPRGRLIEVYGEESSGKTTMALFIAGQLQKTGKQIAFIDVEQAFDANWARKLGVDTNKMAVAQPSTVETSMDIIRTLVATDAIDLIIVDSLEAMIPSKDLEEGALDKDTIGVKARLLNKYLRVLTSEASKTKTVLLFINQTRSNVGVLYGPKDITPGGKAMKFYASIRMAVKKGEVIKNGTEQVGNTVHIVTKKNKVAPPFREVELDLYYNSGIDLIKDLVDTASKYEIITKTGNTYSFGDIKLGVGKDKTRDTLAADSNLYESIFQKVKEAIKAKA